MPTSSVSSTPTPGQIAYEASFSALYTKVPTSSDAWTWLTPHVQAAWEAAAQAVLAMQEPQEETP